MVCFYIDTTNTCSEIIWLIERRGYIFLLPVKRNKLIFTFIFLIAEHFFHALLTLLEQSQPVKPLLSENCKLSEDKRKILVASEFLSSWRSAVVSCTSHIPRP